MKGYVVVIMKNVIKMIKGKREWDSTRRRGKKCEMEYNM